jgi:hypothetical protein
MGSLANLAAGGFAKPRFWDLDSSRFVELVPTTEPAKKSPIAGRKEWWLGCMTWLDGEHSSSVPGTAPVPKFNSVGEGDEVATFMWSWFAHTKELEKDAYL